MFWSAARASSGQYFFLSKAAVEFLEYTGKEGGNNLEQTLYRKLQDFEELARLKVDAIMFYFIYAELVMLVKSEGLQKSALDMNQHYLEFQIFLKLIQDPKFTLNQDHRVFVSEERCKMALNHRIRQKNKLVYTRLFQPDDWDDSILFPLLSAGALKMDEKLSTYAKNQLPGGKYWLQ
jgi:hypothetical protein